MLNEHGRSFIGTNYGTDLGRWWTFGEAVTIVWKMFPMQNALAKEKSIICDLALMKCNYHFYIVWQYECFAEF
jgi:hypothetical protein